MRQAQPVYLIYLVQPAHITGYWPEYPRSLGCRRTSVLPLAVAVCLLSRSPGASRCSPWCIVIAVRCSGDDYPNHPRGRSQPPRSALRREEPGRYHICRQPWPSGALLFFRPLPSSIRSLIPALRVYVFLPLVLGFWLTTSFRALTIILSLIRGPALTLISSVNFVGRGGVTLGTVCPSRAGW